MILAAALAFWGIVVHRVCDWLLQSDWMAKHKAAPRYVTRWVNDQLTGRNFEVSCPWWDRHPAAYVHAGIHGVGFLALAILTPWTAWAAGVVFVTHLLIDTRVPVAWWSRLVRQTQPAGLKTEIWVHPKDKPEWKTWNDVRPLYDVGTEVRIWSDQVWHEVVVCALAVLLVLL